MSPLPYIISEKALADLEGIWYYTVKNWSVEQANRYYELLLQEIDYVCQRPESGKNMGHIRKGYRMVKMKSHLIFYRCTQNRIEVIRILHQQMDIDNRLME